MADKDTKKVGYLERKTRTQAAVMVMRTNKRGQTTECEGTEKWDKTRCTEVEAKEIRGNKTQIIRLNRHRRTRKPKPVSKVYTVNNTRTGDIQSILGDQKDIEQLQRKARKSKKLRPGVVSDGSQCATNLKRAHLRGLC